jgi:hypothetical protein
VTLSGDSGAIPGGGCAIPAAVRKTPSGSGCTLDPDGVEGFGDWGEILLGLIGEETRATTNARQPCRKHAYTFTAHLGISQLWCV